MHEIYFAFILVHSICGLRWGASCAAFSTFRVSKTQTHTNSGRQRWGQKEREYDTILYNLFEGTLQVISILDVIN